MNNFIYSKLTLKEYEYFQLFSTIILKDIKALCAGRHTELKDDILLSMWYKIIHVSAWNYGFSVINHMLESSLQNAPNFGIWKKKWPVPRFPDTHSFKWPFIKLSEVFKLTPRQNQRAWEEVATEWLLLCYCTHSFHTTVEGFLKDSFKSLFKLDLGTSLDSRQPREMLPSHPDVSNTCSLH